MRHLFALLGFLLVPSICFSQTSGTDAESVISRMISSGGYDGVATKQLGRMGDAAAVAVTKVLADKNPSPSEIDMLLAITHFSFSSPEIIGILADREPRTTLFVLQHLNSYATDQTLKQRIAEERKFVLDQFAKSKKN